MTPAQFRSWRLRLRLTQDAAAEALGLNKRTLIRYERGADEDRTETQWPVPRSIVLACRAIEAGLGK